MLATALLLVVSFFIVAAEELLVNQCSHMCECECTGDSCQDCGDCTNYVKTVQMMSPMGAQLGLLETEFNWTVHSSMISFENLLVVAIDHPPQNLT